MEGLHFLEKIKENIYCDVNLPVYIVKNKEDWDNFYKKYSYKFIPEIFNTVTMALREDLLTVPIFKILFVNNGKSITLICKRDNFNEALKKCIKYFEETEEFEKCRKALNLIENE